MAFNFADSTCSRDSCSICESHSSADDESEKSWTGQPNAKAKSNAENQPLKEKPIQPVAMVKTMKYRKNVQISKSPNQLPKTRFNIPKPELKVSHYARKPQKASSKNGAVSHYGPSKSNLSRSASEADFIDSKNSNSFTANYANHVSSTELADPLKYQPNKIETIRRPLPRSPFVTTQMLQSIPQHHHVVDIVPKPHTRPQDPWNAPDQTIGIPITNPTPMLGYHDMPSIESAANFPRQTILLPSHMQIAAEPRSAHLHSQPTMILPLHQPVIHHPLVSGHIPSFQTTENYLMKAQMPFDGPPLPLPPKPRQPIASSILATSTTQTNAQSKRENGERNKVKFSDTVTVAVVPVREQFYLASQTKKLY